MKSSANDARTIISELSCDEIEAWREVVEKNALAANQEFLERVDRGTSEKGLAVAFVGATALAVALVVSRRCELQQRKWLIRFDKGLFSILEAVRDTHLEQVLPPVEKSHFDLIVFCSCTAIEDMLNDVANVGHQSELDEVQLYAHFRSLVQKFAFDCEDYLLRHDIVGDSSRSESEWEQVSEIGSTLADWMEIVVAANVKFTKIDAKTIGEKLQEFDARFPRRIPSSMLTYFNETIISNKSQTSSGALVGNKSDELNSPLDCGAPEPPNEVTLTSNLPKVLLPIKNTFKRRRHKKGKKKISSAVAYAPPENASASSPAQTAANVSLPSIQTGDDDEKSPDNESVIESNMAQENQLDTSVDRSPLQAYLTAAKEAKQAIEGMVQQHEGGSISPAVDALVVGKWTTAVKDFFERAARMVDMYLGSGQISEETASAYSEATVLAVSLVTTSTNVEEFRRTWVLKAVTLLAEIYTKAEKSEFAEALAPASQSYKVLLRYCIERFQDYLSTTIAYVRNIERSAPEEIEADDMQANLASLAERFYDVCLYCIVRHQDSDIEPWADEQWRTFSEIGSYLSSWTEVALLASLSLPKRLVSLRKVLGDMQSRFPGKLPKSLLRCVVCVKVDEMPAGSRAGTNNPVVELSNLERENAGEISVGTKRPGSVVDGLTPPSQIKRVKRREYSIGAYIDSAILSYYGMATQLSQRLEVGEEIEPFSKEAGQMRLVMCKAMAVNKLIVQNQSLGDIQVAAKRLGEATVILRNSVCSTASECVEHHVLKGILKQYAQVAEIAAKNNDQLFATVTASMERLQKYWDDDVSNPFVKILKHVEDTNKFIGEMTPEKLETPLRLLFVNTAALAISTSSLGKLIFLLSGLSSKLALRSLEWC